MKRAAVFIDGSNFYFRLKALAALLQPVSLLHFKYRAFAHWLTAPDTLNFARYYIGTIQQVPGNAKSGKLYANQQKLFASLEAQNVAIVRGHLIKHPDGSFHEKGVDVRIAVEMIRLARENGYDIAYLLSSDTDLVPAVEEVQSLGKEVCYVGVPRKLSLGLSKVANNVRALTSEDIGQFLPLE